MKKNVYLRVKLKSLAEEARIIRIEESRAVKAQNYDLQGDLRFHRITKVREATRETLLAYQFLRGIPYLRVEKANSAPFNVKAVLTMINKYGDRKREKSDIEAWMKCDIKVAA